MKKKMLSRRIGAAGLAAAMLLGMTACGGSDMAASESFSKGTNQLVGAVADSEYGYTTESAPEEMYQESAEGASGNTGNKNADYYQDRKLIRTVNLNLETREFDHMVSLVEGKVSELGGYIESMQTYNGSRYSGRVQERYSNLTIRVPKDSLNEFLNAVSEAGNVVNRSENVQDVTLAYVDMESHRDSLKTEQERLLVLLENAQSLEDIITLEERLSDVRYQLESMESQLRTYDNKVDFATVHMEIDEVKELTPVVEKTVGQRIADGFVRSLKNVGEGFVDFFVVLVVCSPYLVTWALIVAAIVGIIKLCIRRSQKKNAAKQKESEK